MNWSNGRAPSGATAVAQFGASRTTTINFNTTTTLGTLQFDAGAPAYVFNIGSANALTLSGTGVRNLSTNVSTFNVSGRLNFTGGASAANAILSTAAGGIIDFSGVTSGTPTAGSIAGAGTFYLGTNGLEVGSLSSNTTLSGSILNGSGAKGSLRKVGTGTLTLTGRSAFTGTTTISGGSLDVLGGGRLEGTSAVTLGDLSNETGTLRVSGAQSRVTTTGSVIAGNAGRGTITLEDGGTLTASSVILGSQARSAGTLNLGTGGGAGVLSTVSVVGGAGSGSVVNINHTQSSYTVSANLLSALTLNHNGSGTTTLTGTNSYSGGTNLNAGTLRVGASNSLGGAASALNFNGGTLQTSATITNFNHAITLGVRGGTLDTGSFSVTVTTPVSGSGRLTKTGSGILTLNGVSSHTGGTTVREGTLRGTTSSLVGDIVNDASIVFLQTTSGTYAGRMSGTGSLTKLNAGNLTLTGTNSFTGSTTVSSGMLTVNGSLASGVTVGESGALAGVGTISGVVNIAGALAPGATDSNSIGTLTVRNNVTFAPGSVFRVDANSSGRADRLDATGSLAIDGATMEVVADPSGNWQPNTSYTVMTAGRGVRGEFLDVTTDLAFLTPSLSYGANEVALTLTRNDVGFSSVARNSTQLATARYLQSVDSRSGTSNNVVRAVTQSSASQARSLFEQVSGAELAGLSRMSKENTTKLFDVVASRGDEGRGMWMQALSEGTDPVVAAAREGQRSSTPGWRSSGIVSGIDTAVGDAARLGFGVSYANTDVSLDDEQSIARVQTPQAMIYGSATRGAVQVDVVTAFGRPEYRARRQLSALGGGAAVSEHSATELSLHARLTPAAQTLIADGFEPMLAFSYVRSNENRFTEAGSDASLSVAERRSQWFTSDLGVRFTRELVGSGRVLQMQAVWSRDLLGNPSDFTASLAGDDSGEAFSVAGRRAPRDGLQFGVTLNGRTPRDYSFQLNAAYDESALTASRGSVIARVVRAW